MKKNKLAIFLIANTLLGSLSFTGVTLAESLSESNSEKFVEQSSESSLKEATAESVEEVLSRSASSDNSTVESTTDENSEEAVVENDESSEYYYPSNRSDLEPSAEMRGFSAKATNDNLLITDKSIPRSDFIDISSHNGVPTVEEFKIIKSYNVTGVVVKLTEGTSYKNLLAKQQISNARSAGLMVSAYHYSWFTNAESARKEANYFTSAAKEFNLSTDTLMVNDIEDGQLKPLNDNTANSIAFENQLKANGYKNVNHYLGLHWINEKRIDPDALGNSKIWVAAYPYRPTTQQQHTQYGAWQWTSKMVFPRVNGVFDMSSDYVGNYTSKVTLPPQGNYIADGRFVKVTKKGYSTWSNFDWTYRESTNNLYGKTFEARGRYQHLNGSTYFSLYDNQGKWYGYLNSEATSILNGPQGNYIADGRYVSIESKTETVWNDLSFKKAKLPSEKIYQKTYLAKGKYEHFNGKVYYSLYDGQGNWIGYIDANATKIAPNKNGSYIADGRYVTIKNKNYNTWANFSWKSKHSGAEIYQKTYHAKGRYENANGSTYLSLYDNEGVWYGYINSNAADFASGPQGVYIAQSSYGAVYNEDTHLYNDFNGTVRQSTKGLYQRNFYAKGRYHHIDGTVYHSLYDQTNKWQGYAKSETLKITNNAQGPYIAYNKKIKVIKKNYPIWGNFSWKQKADSTTYYGESLNAKGQYKHANGAVYYSLYDNEDNWVGYINSVATK